MTILKSELELAAEATGHDPLSLSAVFEQAIDKGLTPQEAAEKEAESVFGIGYKRDAKGRPIEIGRGSNANQTSQHLTALKRWESGL